MSMPDLQTQLERLRVLLEQAVKLEQQLLEQIEAQLGVRASSRAK